MLKSDEDTVLKFNDLIKRSKSQETKFTDINNGLLLNLNCALCKFISKFYTSIFIQHLDLSKNTYIGENFADFLITFSISKNLKDL